VGRRTAKARQSFFTSRALALRNLQARLPARFWRDRLQQVRFRRVRLHQVQLRRSRLFSRVRFYRARLQQVRFHQILLRQVRFYQVLFRRVRLHQVSSHLEIFPPPRFRRAKSRSGLRHGAESGPLHQSRRSRSHRLPPFPLSNSSKRPPNSPPRRPNQNRPRGRTLQSLSLSRPPLSPRSFWSE